MKCDSSKNKLVSVIIPTFNSSGFILKSLHSVIEQTYSDLEIIIVDDFSEDSKFLKEMCEFFFEDNKIKNYKIYYSKTKLFGCGSRNLGVELSSGSMISFLDAGDVWLPNKIQEQVDLFKSIDDDKSVIYTQVFRGEDISSSIIMPNIGINASLHVSEYIFSSGLIQTSTIFLSKELFNKVRFTEGLVRHQDYDLCLKLFAKNAKFYFINKPLVHWVLEGDFNVTKKGESYYFCKEWIYGNKKYCNESGLLLYVSRSLFSNAINSNKVHCYFYDIFKLFGVRFFFLNVFNILKIVLRKIGER